MTDIPWPDDLAPFQQAFWLQPHVGGSESPFSRQRKVYELSAPRWVTSMAFRGGYDGESGLGLVGGRIDALLVRLKGGVNRALIYDFRRSTRTGAGGTMADLDGTENTFSLGETFSLDEVFVVDHSAPPQSVAALAGATTMQWTGFAPFSNTPFNPGDYVGGDGRCHIATVAPSADSEGRVTVTFEPPLSANVDAGDGIFEKVTSPFRLTSDDAGSNPTEVGQSPSHSFDLVEDL